jgi:hypothetical protein
MTLDRCGRHGRAGLWLAALMSLAPAGAEAAEAPARERPPPTKGEEVDAELLRDLEVLNNTNYARDREIAKNDFFERRMLQTLPGPTTISRRWTERRLRPRRRKAGEVPCRRIA